MSRVYPLLNRTGFKKLLHIFFLKKEICNNSEITRKIKNKKNTKANNSQWANNSLFLNKKQFKEGNLAKMPILHFRGITKRFFIKYANTKLTTLGKGKYKPLTNHPLNLNGVRCFRSARDSYAAEK